MVRRPFDIDPFDDIRNIIRKMMKDFDELFDEKSEISINIVGGKPFVDIDNELIKVNENPPIDYEIQETDKDIILIVELPGSKEGDFDTKITSKTVTVSFKRKNEGIYEERVLNINLPKEVVPEKAKVSFNNGILEIIIPKKN